MKMLVITAIQMFEEDILKMLRENNVHAFSSTELVGYGNKKASSLDDNWFGGSNGKYQSMLFFAFLPESGVDDIFNAVEAFNSLQKTQSRVHISLLNVEKSN